MNKQTLVYAQFLTEGDVQLKGEASFPIPPEFGAEIFGHKLTEMRNSISSLVGDDPVEIIRTQLNNTINLFAHAYATKFPREEFIQRRKEKIIELCAKFNPSV